MLDTAVINESREDWSQTTPMTLETTTLIKKSPETVIDGVVRTLGKTKDLIVDESKTIAPEMVDTVKQSNERMEKQERIISFMPNTYLYYGLVVAGIFVVIKIIK